MLLLHPTCRCNNQVYVRSSVIIIIKPKISKRKRGMLQNKLSGKNWETNRIAPVGLTIETAGYIAALMPSLCVGSTVYFSPEVCSILPRVKPNQNIGKKDYQKQQSRLCLSQQKKEASLTGTSAVDHGLTHMIRGKEKDFDKPKRINSVK